jgi:hypothetical protein
MNLTARYDKYFDDFQSELFKDPKMGTYSNLIYIVDNTLMFKCLISYLRDQPTDCNSLTPPHPMTLQQSMRVSYDIADRWFVLTVIFSVLNVLGVGALAALIYFYRRSKQEY